MNDRLTGARSAGFPETRTGSKPPFEPVAVSGRQIRPSGESTRNRSFVTRTDEHYEPCLVRPEPLPG